ncbi:hypothetical protein [Cetobacterium sp.]|uniref:hypothetical protein n=1 Tax=Cetobacterium sp. TaxID=2071632 RepID=UPI002FC9BBC5
MKSAIFWKAFNELSAEGFRVLSVVYKLAEESEEGYTTATNKGIASILGLTEFDIDGFLMMFKDGELLEWLEIENERRIYVDHQTYLEDFKSGGTV